MDDTYKIDSRLTIKGKDTVLTISMKENNLNISRDNLRGNFINRTIKYRGQHYFITNIKGINPSGNSVNSLNLLVRKM
jgi:hypothetical protein